MPSTLPSKIALSELKVQLYEVFWGVLLGDTPLLLGKVPHSVKPKCKMAYFTK